MSKVAGKSLLFLSFNLIYLMSTDITVQSASTFYNISCKGYTTSNFKTNLGSALGNLSHTNSGYGFFNFSSGQNPDKAYAIALCRGDIEPTSCDSCVQNSIVKTIQICCNYEDAIGCFDECMVKYSNEEILGRTTVVDQSITSGGDQKVTDVDGFDQDVSKLMDNLKIRAARESPLRKYAADTMTRADSSKIYGVVQYTPDLSEQQCSSCLTDAVGRIAGCCSGDSGARVFLPLCNFRYENYPFYGEAVAIPPQSSQAPPTSPPASQAQLTSPPASPLAPPTSPPPASNGKRVTLIIIVTLAAVFAIIIAFVCTIVIWRKKRMPTKRVETKTMEQDVTGFSEYDFGMVKASTNDFAKQNMIVQGGFGTLYKGELEHERLIAVKRLSKDAGQVEPQEFRNAVSLVAKIQHQNLVRLLGFSLEGEERLLIYEFLPDASLDQVLSDPNKRTLLDWGKSYKIIEGVAQGLLYLHENLHLSIIHRGLKASNVLLDSDMNPKITDFGMTKLFAPGGSQGNTTTISGTDGYMPPEYQSCGPLSVKLDVFSFGVLVLEIIKGQMYESFRNEDGVNLLSYAWRSWQDKKTSNITDTRLLNEPNSLPHISRSIHIALLCVQESAMDRPTMSLVVGMMNSVSQLTQAPSQPAFYNDNETSAPSQVLAMVA